MFTFACFADDCPRDQNGSRSGNFSSPDYPINYPYKKTCAWGITVPGDYRILVTFDEFNTQRNSDVLKIYDGASNSSDVLETLSGRLSSGFIYGSSGSSLWFEFTTDGSVSEKGFYATYTQHPSTYRPDSHFMLSSHFVLAFHWQKELYSCAPFSYRFSLHSLKPRALIDCFFIHSLIRSPLPLSTDWFSSHT